MSLGNFTIGFVATSRTAWH